MIYDLSKAEKIVLDKRRENRLGATGFTNSRESGRILKEKRDVLNIVTRT